MLGKGSFLGIAAIKSPSHHDEVGAIKFYSSLVINSSSVGMKCSRDKILSFAYDKIYSFPHDKMFSFPHESPHSHAIKYSFRTI